MYDISYDWQDWPYKGTDKMKVKAGLEAFFTYYPKKVRKALWWYDVWTMLDDDNKLAYVQEWAKANTDMHVYPFGSLDEVAEYLINNEGYSYRDLVSVGYDSVNHISLYDDIWVWTYEGELRSYSDFNEFLQDFKEFDDWDNFVNWATQPYGYGNPKYVLKRVLQLKNVGVHLDYMEMLGDYFGAFLDQLTGEKRDWFILRIKTVYQVGDEEAEQILQGKENE